MTRPLELTLPFLIPDVEEGEAPRMEYEWGRVQDDGRVLIDQESTPLPASVSSLVALYPGQRVLVLRYGRGVVVVGSFQHGPVQIGLGQSADEFLYPGQYLAADGEFVATSEGFPVTGEAGWLEVAGDGEQVLQRFTSSATGTAYTRRRLGGVWQAWASAAPAPGPWTNLPISSPWESYSGFGEFAYRLEGDVVRLSGTVRYGTGTEAEPFTTLPAEARPRTSRLVTMTTAAGGALGYVTTEGVVYLNGTIPTGSWVSVEGITYRA